MRISHNAFILLAGLFLINGCHSRQEHFIISGYLYADCSMTPLPNHYLELKQGVAGGLVPTSGGFLASGYTDADGYFELLYDPENTLDVTLSDDDYDLLVDIPANKDVDDLVVFKTPTSNVQVYMHVINPYTVADQLILYNSLTYETDTISGPFYSGVIYTFENTYVEMSYIGTRYSLSYYVNDIDNYLVTNFNIKTFCADTTFVEFDLY